MPRRLLSLLSLFSILIGVCLVPLAAADQATETYQQVVSPFLSSACVECHGPDKQKSGIRLDTLARDFTNPQTSAVWTSVLEQLTTGAMPPTKVTKRPAQSSVQAVGDWIATQVRAGEAQRASATLRRLNRREYQNTIRDLLAVDLDLSIDIPSDQLQYGFDTVGAALSISATHMRQYAVIAKRAVDMAITTSAQAPRHQYEWFARRYPSKEDYDEAAKNYALPGFKSGQGSADRDRWLATGYRQRLLIPEDGLTDSGIFGAQKIHFGIETPGVYEFRARCGSRPHPSMPGTPRITMSLNGRIIMDRAVENPLDATTHFTVRVPLQPGHYEMCACNGFIAPVGQRVGQPHKLSARRLTSCGPSSRSWSSTTWNSRGRSTTAGHPRAISSCSSRVRTAAPKTSAMPPPSWSASPARPGVVRRGRAN